MLFMDQDCYPLKGRINTYNINVILRDTKLYNKIYIKLYVVIHIIIYGKLYQLKLNDINYRVNCYVKFSEFFFFWEKRTP